MLHATCYHVACNMSRLGACAVYVAVRQTVPYFPPNSCESTAAHRLGRSRRPVLLPQGDFVQFAVPEMRQFADEVDMLRTFIASDLRPAKSIQIDLGNYLSRPQYHDGFDHFAPFF